MQQQRVIILGGGAAGFFSALACKEENPAQEVTILEKTNRLLQKVKISGGGRCNVTHACFDPKRLVQHYPRGHKELLGPFYRFQPKDTIQWFMQRGVSLKTEEDGSDKDRRYMRSKTRKKTDKEQQLFDNLLKTTYECIKGKRYKPLSREHLIEKLRIHQEHLAIFDRVLKDLKEKGSVIDTAGKYSLKEHAEPKIDEKLLTTGKLSVHPRGFGFVRQQNDTADVFIPKPHIGSAIDGDIVRVKINENVSEKGPEGIILDIIERTKKHIVVTIVQKTESTFTGYSLQPGQSRYITIKKNPQFPEIGHGDRLLVCITSWEESRDTAPVAKIIQKIGHVDDPASDIAFAIHENSLSETFPEEVLEEARQFGSRVRKQDMLEREDFRDLSCVTIDPTTAKDFDDAVSLEENTTGFSLGVHIADVSHYVTPDSALDEEAKKRCNSTYFPNYCLPMLPHELSSHLCSLKEGVLRLAVSVMMRFDLEGNLLSSDVIRSVIRSSKRFTYKQAKEVLDNQKKSPYKPLLDRMVRLCELLKVKRKERGSVELYIPELAIEVSAEGVPTSTEIIEYDITHQMIEEFMLKTNETIAQKLAQANRSISFRVHEEPASDSLRDLSVLANAFGYTLAEEPTPHDIQAFFAEVAESPYAQYLATCYIRTMRLACYSADNIGHYGLSLEHYCHFTSPIRRYADIIVHRQLFLKKPLDKQYVTALCGKVSDQERISARAEGLVRQIKKLRLLQSYKEKDPFRTFEAVITKVKPFGFHFDILELMFEGFVHISSIDDDFFVFDPSSLMLLGRYSGQTIQSGNTIIVALQSVDLIIQEAKWKCIAHKQESISEAHIKQKLQQKSPRKKRNRYQCKSKK